MVCVGFVDPENLLELGMQRPVRDEVIDRASWQECRIQLEQRLRPQRTVVQCSVDFRADVGISYLDKTACVACVVADEALAELKNVHRRASPGSSVGAAAAAGSEPNKRSSQRTVRRLCRYARDPNSAKAAN